MATTTNNIFSKEDVLYLKQYINFDDAFHLNFCRSQGKIFYDNIKDISYIYELNHCNVFNRIQKFHLDELVIFLSKWGRNYDYLNLINDGKIRSILPITKEKYGKDYDFFEVVEALILCGSPTILIADCNDDNEMISQIATTRLLSEIYDIPIPLLISLMTSSTAVETDLDPYILFSTKSLITTPPLVIADVGQTITWSCPGGELLTDCYGVPSCVTIESVPCGTVLS
jgi:hypothetical protein